MCKLVQIFLVKLDKHFPCLLAIQWIELNAAEICEHPHQSCVYHSVWNSMTITVQI